MTEPEETGDEAERPEPILAPPTANPTRVQVPPEGAGQRTDERNPGPSGSPAEEG